MDAVKNNKKVTLLNFYGDCLWGFMSWGKQVLQEEEQ